LCRLPRTQRDADHPIVLPISELTPATVDPRPPRSGAIAAPVLRCARVYHFCPWADRLQDGGEYLRALPGLDLLPRVSNPRDPALLRMARLDCDWHGENVRALGAMTRGGMKFLDLRVLGVPGLADLAAAAIPTGEESWFVITGQHPQKLGGPAGRLLAAYGRKGVRTLYYAFDESSRSVANFAEIAPHLSVLIHDEFPLGPAPLPDGCLKIHRSWVANLVPYAAPFCESPEEKILFLGSRLGLTPHRRRQIEFLRARFKDRFVAVCDHSLPVSERLGLGRRFKVSVCPEGRKFATPGMRATHTDRPFWSGCLGMVPVSEDSREGGRLEELHRKNLIWRYPHSDLKALAAACEAALALGADERRRVYHHFNRWETVGTVVADAIHAAGPCP
jgi:hypothetical protein